MPTNDLNDYASDAASRMGFGSIGERMDATYADDPDPEEQDADDQDDAEDEEVEEGEDESAGVLGAMSDQEYAALGARFWGSLDPAEYAAAEADESVREAVWNRFLAAEGVVQAMADATPTTAVEVIQRAYADPDSLTGEDGERMTPAEWTAQWVEESPAEWAKACRAIGWPEATPQPSHEALRRLGRGAQGDVLSSSWDQHLEKMRERGRFLGGG